MAGAKFESSSDSFVTFLKTIQRTNTTQQAQRGEARPASNAPVKLLLLLADAGAQPIPVTELMTKSGMSFTEFAEALDTIRKLDLVALAGLPRAESVTLTPNGVTTAQMVRPLV